MGNYTLTIYGDQSCHRGLEQKYVDIHVVRKLDDIDKASCTYFRQVLYYSVLHDLSINHTHVQLFYLCFYLL